MSNKTLSILSYITIIGWLIAYIKSKDNQPSNSLVTYHLKQGFGLFLLSLAFNIVLYIIVMIIPSLAMVGLVGYIFLIFMIFGIINAAGEHEKPIPVIGKMFENKFDFIG